MKTASPNALELSALHAAQEPSRAAQGPVPATPVAGRLLRRGLPLAVLLALGGCAGLSVPVDRNAPPTASARPADNAPVAAGTSASAPQPAASPAPSAAPAVTAAPGTPGTPTTPPAQAAAPSAAATRLSPAAQEAALDLPRLELTPQLLFQVLASEVAAQRGQVGSATITYLALARQTRDPRLARRATELALAERSMDRALQAAQLWREAAPESMLASQTLEALWLTTGRLDAIEPLLAQRLQAARAESRLEPAYRELVRSLSRAPDRSAALALFDRLAAPDQDFAPARLAAAALAERADKPQRAAAEAAEAHRLNPLDEDIALNAARALQQSDAGPAAALALLERFLRAQPKALEARFAYARLLASEGRNAEARAQMEEALRLEPDSPAILFSLAQIAYQTDQLAEAADYLQRYLELPDDGSREATPAWLFLAQIEEDRGRLPQAIDWLSRVTEGDQRLPALMRRALLVSRMGQMDEAREILRRASVVDRQERSQLIGAEVQMLRESGLHADAFEVIDQALKAQPDSPDLLYDHAMAAERIDRIDVLETSLRRLIGLRPDNAHAYNALGYTLADRNLRLDEAHALIEKALELAPEDPHIIDSMGWVLYRKGRLDDAVLQLRRAWALERQAEIGVHLGEVLWKLGLTSEARRIWRDARALEPDNELLQKTLSRLDVTL